MNYTDKLIEEYLTEAPDMYGLPTDDELEAEYQAKKAEVAKKRAELMARANKPKLTITNGNIDKIINAIADEAKRDREYLNLLVNIYKTVLAAAGISYSAATGGIGFAELSTEELIDFLVSEINKYLASEDVVNKVTELLQKETSKIEKVIGGSSLNKILYSGTEPFAFFFYIGIDPTEPNTFFKNALDLDKLLELSFSDEEADEDAVEKLYAEYDTEVDKANEILDALVDQLNAKLLSLKNGSKATIDPDTESIEDKLARDTYDACIYALDDPIIIANYESLPEVINALDINSPNIVEALIAKTFRSNKLADFCKTITSSIDEYNKAHDMYDRMWNPYGSDYYAAVETMINGTTYYVQWIAASSANGYGDLYFED